MSNRLVFDSIHILHLLLDKNLHYNEIIRQTSSDRSHVDNVIDTLEARQLIMEYKISKQERKRQKIHSQAKIMTITKLGREIALFKNNIERYETAYSAIIKTVSENFGVKEGVSENVLKSKLQSNNWTSKEIFSYKNWAREARSFGLKSVNIYIIALLIRYIEILSKAGSNELVRNILSTVFTNAINWHFSNGLRDFVETLSAYKIAPNEEEGQITSGMLRHFKKEVLNYISDSTRNYIPHMRPLSNKYIKNEAAELTDSLYSIIEPTGRKDLLQSMLMNLTGRRSKDISDDEVRKILENRL
jgi:hypothetical protein